MVCDRCQCKPILPKKGGRELCPLRKSTYSIRPHVCHGDSNKTRSCNLGITAVRWSLTINSVELDTAIRHGQTMRAYVSGFVTYLHLVASVARVVTSLLEDSRLVSDPDRHDVPCHFLYIHQSIRVELVYVMLSSPVHRNILGKFPCGISLGLMY